MPITIDEDKVLGRAQRRINDLKRFAELAQGFPEIIGRINAEFSRLVDLDVQGRHLDDESKALVGYELVSDIHEIRDSLARSLDYLKKPIDRVLKFTQGDSNG